MAAKKILPQTLIFLLLQLITYSTSAQINYYTTSTGNCSEILSKGVSPIDRKFTSIRNPVGRFKVRRPSGSWNRQHNGIDLMLTKLAATQDYIPVYAVADGILIKNQMNGSITSSFGNIKILDHGQGCYSLYSHLTDLGDTQGLSERSQLNKKYKAGDIIGYLLERRSDGSMMTPTGNIRKLKGTAKYHLHFSLISSNKLGSGNIRHTFFHNPDKTQQYGYWIDPTPLFKRLNFTEKLEDTEYDCPPGSLVCQIDPSDVNNWLQEKTSLDEEHIQLMSSKFSYDKFKSTKNMVYKSSAIGTSIVASQMEEILKKVKSSKAMEELRKDYEKQIEEEYLGASLPVLNQSSKTVTKVRSNVQSLLEMNNVECSKNHICDRLTRHIIESTDADGIEQALIKTTTSYALRKVLSSEPIEEIFNKTVQIQERITDYSTKIHTAKKVSDDFNNIVEEIDKMQNSQQGFVEGAGAVVAMANSMVNGLESLGIKDKNIKKAVNDATNAVQTVSAVNNLMDIGIKYFTSGGPVNPVAAMSSASSLLGISSGGSSGDPFVRKQLAAIQNQLKQMDRKLDKILDQLDIVIKNQEKMISMIQEVQEQLDRMEKANAYGFDRLYEWNRIIVDSIDELKLNAVANCNEIENRIDKYYELMSINKNQLYDLNFKHNIDHYNQFLSPIAKDGACQIASGNSEICQYKISRKFSQECIQGLSQMFQTSCMAPSYFVQPTTTWMFKDECSKKSNSEKSPDNAQKFCQGLIVSSKLYGVGKKSMLNDTLSNQTQKPILNKKLGKKIYGYGLPSLNHDILKEKLVKNQQNKLFENYICDKDRVKRRDFHQLAATPIKENDVLYWSVKLYKLLPFLWNAKDVNGRRLLSSADIVSIIDKASYLLEMLIIQKNMLQGDAIISTLAEYTRSSEDKQKQSIISKNISQLLHNPESTLATNLGLYLVYSSSIPPYGDYYIAHEQCVKNNTCSTLIDLLQLGCVKKKGEICVKANHPIKKVKSKSAYSLLSIQLSVDGKKYLIPLPKPLNTHLNDSSYVYSQGIKNIYQVYFALNRYRIYIQK